MSLVKEEKTKSREDKGVIPAKRIKKEEGCDGLFLEYYFAYFYKRP